MSREALGPNQDSPMSCFAVIISALVIVGLIALAVLAVISGIDRITENFPTMYYGDHDH